MFVLCYLNDHRWKGEFQPRIFVLRLVVWNQWFYQLWENWTRVSFCEEELILIVACERLDMIIYAHIVDFHSLESCPVQFPARNFCLEWFLIEFVPEFINPSEVFSESQNQLWGPMLCVLLLIHQKEIFIFEFQELGAPWSFKNFHIVFIRL